MADLRPTRAVATTSLQRPAGPLPALLKWPGGKARELPGLMPRWPSTAGRYLEPFVGGGSVLMAIAPDVPAEVNDASVDLVALYLAIKERDAAVLDWLGDFATWWTALGGHDEVVAALAGLHLADEAPEPRAAAVLDAHLAGLLATVPDLASGLADEFAAQLRRGVPRKLGRMRKVQSARGVDLPDADVLANVEGAIRAAAYTAIRTVHNASRRRGEHGHVRTGSFAVLRELAYAAMFRFNAGGDFNVPYGGISYNGRDLAARLRSWADPDVRGRLDATTIHVGDFADFFDRAAPRPDDFVFLDPPYLSDFRDYDGNGFGPHDHQRLAACLRDLPCPFQLVIKATPEVRDWYAHPGWSTIELDKTYAWTIKGRNDRRATHLVIENR